MRTTTLNLAVALALVVFLSGGVAQAAPISIYNTRPVFIGPAIAGPSVQMELDDDTWHLVKDTPRVMGFIGGKADQPAPITEAEASAILQRVEEGVEAPRPKTLFEPGEMVRVVDGPFNDFNGVVE